MTLALLAPIHSFLHGLTLPQLSLDDLHYHLRLEPELFQLLLALPGHHPSRIANDRDILY
jgi:hypothetical protein